MNLIVKHFSEVSLHFNYFIALFGYVFAILLLFGSDCVQREMWSEIIRELYNNTTKYTILLSTLFQQQYSKLIKAAISNILLLTMDHMTLRMWEDWYTLIIYQPFLELFINHRNILAYLFHYFGFPANINQSTTCLYWMAFKQVSN